MIEETVSELGRPITILDVGGRPDYWQNVMPNGVAKIILLNLQQSELARDAPADLAFEARVGNACELNEWHDQSVDFVHSNSVIEHVGRWIA